MARWWPLSARRAWGSRAWCTSSSTPTTSGVVGARKRFGVVWQGDAILPGDRPAQALQPCGRARRHAYHPGQGDRAGADARPGSSGHGPGVAVTPRCPAGRQSVPHARPTQRRQRTLEALKRIFLRESQEQPLLLVFEDLHWIDSETQAWLTAWSRVCPRPGSCCWRTIAPSTSMVGAARPITHNCGSIHCHRPAPTNSCRRCLGMTLAWSHSRHS